MQKFRRKLADVEAVQYVEPDGLHGPDHPTHPLPQGCEWYQFGSTWRPVITIRERAFAVYPGDWIAGGDLFTDSEFRDAFDLDDDGPFAVSINGKSFHCTTEEEIP